MVGARETEAISELVVFEVGARTLGVPGDAVRELVRAVAVTALPGAPDGVDGVIDLRGTFVPVFDLSRRVGIAPRALRATDHLLICEAGRCGVVAVRADRVLAVRSAVTVDAPPEVGTPGDPVVRCLAHGPDGILVVCDLGAFLTAADGDALARAVAVLAAGQAR